jgi:hypothetical protein
MAFVVGAHRLVCTPDHPVFNPRAEAFLPAADWQRTGRGAVLTITDEGIVSVSVAEVHPDAGVHDVFDLTVEGQDATFVASTVVVHNKSYAPDKVEVASTEGPVADISSAEPVRRFRIFPCLEPAAGGELRFDAWLENENVNAASWVARVGLVVPTDGGVAHLGDSDLEGDLWLVADFDEMSCDEGLLLEVRYLTPQYDGELGVAWEVSTRVDPAYDGTAKTTIEQLP